ncbi:hypothetical protein KMW28_17025 [Flammeovirga yaeyamensis]|uniref:Uncharacterized protein n=1 Tax=Flammeovirga yaeyamensis TaxID=367791 RepID=A0AAX1N1N8_9BACT|nr:hypothetical protein [Flammeovirga yaeyamensis]MBB3698280.1 Zn-dependent M16 (insulinase) family peptidase [Flammeovirga yaeyamensis]NMF34366.1 hypothetical protein [Flammeovirga yaeyamensis]QWG01347.1 hypothetical protein KMW28_17025 [Flammeovirga yaeyamensis]
MGFMDSATKVLQNNRRELKHATSPKFKSDTKHIRHYSLEKIAKKRSQKEIDQYSKKLIGYKIVEHIKEKIVYIVIVALLIWGIDFILNF